MKKIEITKVWLESELKTKAVKQIASEIGCSVETIRRRIREYDIVRSRHAHTINETFFDEWGSDMAYVLGFTFADGCVNNSGHHNQVVYQLNRNDDDVLRYIRDCIQPTKNIYYYDRIDKRTNKTFAVAHLTFSSKKLVERLQELGCLVNKTYTNIHLPNVPDIYLGDFIRGYFDGDGTVNSKRVKIVCNQEHFLREIKKRLGFGHITNTDMPTIGFYSEQDMQKLYYIMYNDGFCLTRKKRKFPYDN